MKPYTALTPISSLCRQKKINYSWEKGVMMVGVSGAWAVEVKRAVKGGGARIYRLNCNCEHTNLVTNYFPPLFT